MTQQTAEDMGKSYREGGQGKHHDQHAGQLAQAHTHPALASQAMEHLTLPPLRIVVALLLHTHSHASHEQSSAYTLLIL